MRTTTPAIFVAAMLGLAAAACSDEPLTSPTPRAASSVAVAQDVIPARGAETKLFHWGLATDSALWAELVERDTLVTVGIKTPGKARGAWRGRLLLTASELVTGQRALTEQPGVRLVRIESMIPAVRLKIADQKTLERIRRLPFVDYVEPTLVRVRHEDSSGCGPSAFSQPITQTVAATTGGLDTLPHSFANMGIVRAWDYSIGANVTIGLTDTGVWDDVGSEFSSAQFASGMSSGRTFTQIRTNNNTQITCHHGSRVAGVLAAPRNGRNVVGVAYKSSLYSVQHHDDVVFITAWDIEDAQQAIHDAAYYGGARVIVMPWGATSYHHAVADEIRAWYNVEDRMFVGASGTCQQLCVLSQNDVVFPADMEEVLAVSAANEDGSRPNSAYWGNQVDVIAYTNQETTGLGTLGIQGIGSTSGATGVAGGVAALVRSRYPSMTNLQVMQRMVATSGRRCGGELVWRDILVNAEAAVGGPCVVNGTVSGPSQVVFGAGMADIFEATFSVQVTGGNGPISYQWVWNVSTGPSANYSITKLPGQDYVQSIRVIIRDTGSNNPGKMYEIFVWVYDRSNCGESGENC